MFFSCVCIIYLYYIKYYVFLIICINIFIVIIYKKYIYDYIWNFFYFSKLYFFLKK